MYVFIQRSIQSVGPLKAFYTSPPATPVHSDINSASLGSIKPCCKYCMKTNSLTFSPLSIAILDTLRPYMERAEKYTYVMSNYRKNKNWSTIRTKGWENAGGWIPVDPMMPVPPLGPALPVPPVCPAGPTVPVPPVTPVLPREPKTTTHVAYASQTLQSLLFILSSPSLFLTHLSGAQNIHKLSKLLCKFLSGKFTPTHPLITLITLNSTHS